MAANRMELAAAALLGCVTLYLCTQWIERFATSDDGSIHVLAPRGGTPYHLAASWIEGTLERGSSNVTPIVSKGSAETIAFMERLAADRKPAIGIVQADVVHHHLNGGHPDFPVGRRGSRVRSVARLFDEWVHVHGGEVQPGARLCLPELGRGGRVTAQTLAGPLGLTLVEGTAGCALQMRVKAPPASERGWNSIGEQAVLALVNAYPGIYRAISTADFRSHYPKAVGVSGEHFTVGVDAILVATTDVPTGTIRSLISSLREGRTAVCPGELHVKGDPLEALAKGSRLCKMTDEELLKGLPIGLHAGAVMAQADPVSQYLWQRQIARLLQILIYGLVAVLLGVRVVGRTRRGLGVSRWTRGELFKAAVLLAGAIVGHLLLAVALWSAEASCPVQYGTMDPKLARGIPTVVWWMVQLATVGKDDIEFVAPFSIGAIGLMKAGWGLSGAAATAVLANNLLRGALVTKKSEHIVIVGVNPLLQEICAEMRSAGNVPNIAYRELPDRPWVPPPTQHLFIDDDLRKAIADAGVARAKTVLVVSDTSAAAAAGDHDVDLWTARVVQWIRRQRPASTENGTPLQIIAQVRRGHNAEMIEALGANATVTSEGFAGRLLAQATFKPGILEVFRELLHTADKNAEIYYDTLAANNLRGTTTWGKFAPMLSAPEGSTRTPIGFRTEKDGVTINPSASAPLTLGSDLEIVVIADAKSDAPWALVPTTPAPVSRDGDLAMDTQPGPTRRD